MSLVFIVHHFRLDALAGKRLLHARTESLPAPLGAFLFPRFRRVPASDYSGNRHPSLRSVRNLGIGRRFGLNLLEMLFLFHGRVNQPANDTPKQTGGVTHQ